MMPPVNTEAIRSGLAAEETYNRKNIRAVFITDIAVDS